MQPPTDQQKLDQARMLLQQQRYDQARPILESMPHNPTAQEWLAYLNQNAPSPNQPMSPPPQPYYIPSPPPVAPIQLPPNLPLAFRQEFRWAIAGVAGLIALVLLILFFAIPLLDGNNFDSYVEDYQDALQYESNNAIDSFDRAEAEDQLNELNQIVDGDIENATVPSLDNVDVTAWQVWMGKASSLSVRDQEVDYEGDFTLSGSEIEDLLMERTDIEDFGGFSTVRLIDRLLIIYPIGAIVIALIGILFALNQIQSRPALISITVTILVLFVFVFVWQSASSSDWRGSVRNQIERAIDDEYDVSDRVLLRAFYEETMGAGEQYVSKVYNTGAFKFFTGLGLLASVGALAFAWVSEKQHPQVVAQFRQLQMQRKAQRMYQQPYMPPPYSMPPQPMPPVPQSPPPMPPRSDPSTQNEWTTPNQ